MAQRPTIRRKANWRFGKSRRPARPVCAKRSNETVSQALDSALRAGRVSGDTGLFQDWLCGKGLQGRGAPLVRRLQAEYERGVVGGDPSPSRPASARPLSIAPEGTYNMPPQSPRSPQSGATTHAQITRYKGIAIEPAGDGWTTNLDRQSHFDTQTDAQRFIDSWSKGGARNPRGGGVLNSKSQANPMHYFDTRKDAQATARLLKRAGYPVLGIETHKATGYGIYRTKAGASLDSDAPGGALEVAFALLGQGKYAYSPATEADMEWFSRQWPEEYTRIVKAFGKDTPSKRNGAKSIMDSPSFSDDERARRLEERAQRLEGKRGDAEQTERKYVLAILKFYHYNGRFPDFSDYELGPVGRNPNRGCEEFSDQGAGYGYSEDGEDGGLDEGPVDPYPGPDVSDIADVLVVANPAGVYRINIVPRSIGGRYALEVRHPDGHYETPQDFANPEYAKDWAERFYKSFYGPYEVLPRLVWKADRSHWGHYSASFKAPKGKRNPNPPNDSLRSPATDTADREGAQTGARDALAGRPKLSKAEAIAAASHYVRHYNETTPSVGDFYYYSYESIYDYTRGQMKGFTVEPLSKKEAAQEADRLKRAGYLNITTEKYKSEYGGLFYRVRAVSPSLRTHPAPHRARMENPARNPQHFNDRDYRHSIWFTVANPEDEARAERIVQRLQALGFNSTFTRVEDRKNKGLLYTDAPLDTVHAVMRRRNPGPEADRLYESFHGCPPEETVLVETEVHEHDHLTQLGDLTELKIKTLTGLEATIDFEKQGVMLCSSEDGKQLYFEGGNQELDLGELDMDGDEWVRDLMVIGELTETTYRTQKAFDKFKTIDYYHENGEDSGVAPDLLYDPISRLMRVAGGQYEVKPEGIVN